LVGVLYANNGNGLCVISMVKTKIQAVIHGNGHSQVWVYV
jgi:hypothetical protein